MHYYLAIDIGASSGRHILGHLESGKLLLTEVHRFKNGYSEKNGYMCWDSAKLFEEIVLGIKKCGDLGKIPKSVGIDTWGVDFVLLNSEGRAISDAVAYRDNRTEGMDKVLDNFISEQELYARIGIQKMPFNTIYQFLAIKEKQPELLEKADGFLLTPEYYSYLLTGKRAHEYTVASTTGLVNAESRDWDYELITGIGLDKGLFSEISPPGKVLGELLPEIAEKVGFNCQVLLPCTHDTASAVVAAPIGENDLYLSSGTWSLMGAELFSPVCTEESRLSNLTNEGGYGLSYRYLKNIMGLWIIQSIRNESAADYSFHDLSTAARECENFPSRIDVNDSRFLAPQNMALEIKAACKDSGQRIPESIGELVSCAYQSLAASYADTVKQIEKLTNKDYDRICIVGGGCQDEYLNGLTAKACAKKVTAGPVEGTAIGNILVQMITSNELKDVTEARKLVVGSF